MEPIVDIDVPPDRRQISWRRWALAIVAAAVVFVVVDLVVIIRMNSRVGLALGFLIAIVVAWRVGRPDGIRQWAGLAMLTLVASILALAGFILAVVDRGSLGLA